MQKNMKIAGIAIGVCLLAVAAIPFVGYLYNHGMIQSKLLDNLLLADKSRMEMREAKADNRSRAVKVGIAGPLEIMRSDTLFLQGIELAVNEINGGGGVLGMKLETVIEDDRQSLTESLRIAQEFAVDIQVVAVIGYWTAAHTMPVAAFYDGLGVLLITPTVTNPALTQNGYKTVFRNTVSDITIGKKMAAYAKNTGYKNIAIYYADSIGGKDLTLAFETEAKKQGVRIIDRHGVFLTKDEFDSAFKGWRTLDVDAVFVADTMRSSRNLVGWVRQEDGDLPILAGNGFDRGNLIEYYGIDSRNIAFAGFPSVLDDGKTAGVFETAFRAKYGVKPDYFALKGYESIGIIRHALETAGSTSPSKLVNALKSGKGFDGVDGTVSFAENGDAKSGTVIVRKVIDGKYATVSR